MEEHSEAILRPERGLEGADRSFELTAFPAPVSGGGDHSEAALAGAVFSWKSTSVSSVSCRGSLPPSLSHPPSPDSHPDCLSIPFIQHMEHLLATGRVLRSAPGNTMRRSPHLCSGEACFPGRLLWYSGNNWGWLGGGFQSCTLCNWPGDALTKSLNGGASKPWNTLLKGLWNLPILRWKNRNDGGIRLHTAYGTYKEFH